MNEYLSVLAVRIGTGHQRQQWRRVMSEWLRDDEGELRLMGTRAFITAAIQRIGSVTSVAFDGNMRANRHGDGHRAHAHVRLAEPTAFTREPELSPLAQAEAAQDRRDLSGEIGALTDADRQLREQSWFPIQPGDVVCWSVPLPDGGRHGETLVAVDDPGARTEGGAPLRCVSETPYPDDPEPDGAAAELAAELEDDEDEDEEPVSGFERDYEDFDLWFEAGAACVTVLRHGQLVHGTPHRA